MTINNEQNGSYWTSSNVSSTTIPGDPNSIQESQVATTQIVDTENNSTETVYTVEEKELEILAALEAPSSMDAIEKVQERIRQINNELISSEKLTGTEVQKLGELQSVNTKIINSVVDELTSLSDSIPNPDFGVIHDSLSTEIASVQDNLENVQVRSFQAISNKVLGEKPVSLTADIRNLQDSLDTLQQSVNSSLVATDDSDQLLKQSFYEAIEALLANGIDCREYDFVSDTVPHPVYSPQKASGYDGGDTSTLATADLGPIGVQSAHAYPGKYSSDATTLTISESYSDLRFINYSVLIKYLIKWKLASDFDGSESVNTAWNGTSFYEWVLRLKLLPTWNDGTIHPYDSSTMLKSYSDNNIVGAYKSALVEKYLVSDSSELDENDWIGAGSVKSDSLGTVLAFGWPSYAKENGQMGFLYKAVSSFTKSSGQISVNPFYIEEPQPLWSIIAADTDGGPSSLYQSGIRLLRILRYLLHKTAEIHNTKINENGIGEEYEINPNWDLVKTITSFIYELPVNTNFDLTLSLETGNLGIVPPDTDLSFEPGWGGDASYPSYFGTLFRGIQSFTDKYIQFQEMISRKRFFHVGPTAGSSELSLEFLPPEVFRDYPHVLRGTKVYDNIQYIDRPIVPYRDPLQIGNSDNQYSNILVEISTVSKDISKKSSRIENIEFSDTLKELAKNGTIDIGNVLLHYDDWVLQVETGLEQYRYIPGSFIPKKYLDILSLSQADLDGLSANKIIIVSVPYGVNKNDLEITIADSTFRPIDDDDETAVLSALHAYYGLDFSVDNFPTSRKVNKPIYPDVLIDDETEKWPWSTISFKNGLPETPVANPYLVSSFLFSEYYMQKTLCYRRFKGIAVFKVSTTGTPIEIRVQENTNDN